MNNDEINCAKINENDIPWAVIESYFKNKHLKQLIRHQLESYNNFVNSQIENTIEMFNPVRICSEHDYIKEHNLYRLEILIYFKNFRISEVEFFKIFFLEDCWKKNFSCNNTN